MSTKEGDLAKRMRDALAVEIKRLRDAQAGLGVVDNEILSTARELFSDDLSAVLWLLEKQRALGDKIPIEVAATPRGREAVLHALRAVQHGVYL